MKGKSYVAFCQQIALSPTCPQPESFTRSPNTQISCLQLVPSRLNHIRKCTFCVHLPQSNEIFLFLPVIWKSFFLLLFLLLFLRRLAHVRGTRGLLRNQPSWRADWICLKHFLISSLCVLFLSNVIWPPQQRFNCGNLGPSQTWALLKVLLKALQLLVLEMTNQKHIESDLVDYWFEDHSFRLSSPPFSFFASEDWNFNCSTTVFNS